MEGTVEPLRQDSKEASGAHRGCYARSVVPQFASAHDIFKSLERDPAIHCKGVNQSPSRYDDSHEVHPRCSEEVFCPAVLGQHGLCWAQAIVKRSMEMLEQDRLVEQGIMDKERCGGALGACPSRGCPCNTLVTNGLMHSHGGLPANPRYPDSETFALHLFPRGFKIGTTPDERLVV